MRALILLWVMLFYLAFYFSASAQDNMRASQWVLGFESNKLDIASNTMLPLGPPSPALTNGYSSICDTNGKLVLYCNGFYLYNNIPLNVDWPSGNWDSINCPLGMKYRNHYGGDGRSTQMSLILPKKDNTYYVISTAMSDSAYDLWQGPSLSPDSFFMDALNYAVIDMDANGGKGQVLQKNVMLSRAVMSHHWTSAVRHGNGKDWWLMKPLRNKHHFMRFLVTETGIYGPYMQYLNSDTIPIGVYGQCKFSEDGTKFAMVHANIFSQAYLYDFDRCTGLLSNYHKLYVPQDTAVPYDWPTGVSFSPNGKLLYVNTYIKVQQYDLADTSLTPLEVGDYGANSAEHFNSNTAINGKIYIGNANGVSMAMATIDSPNVKGLGCAYNKTGLTTTLANFNNVPNITNYGLGAVNKGAGYDGCWPTLIENGALESGNAVVNIFPNPASTKVQCVILGSGFTTGTIKLYDVFGRLLQKQAFAAHSTADTIDVAPFARGTYLCIVCLDNGYTYTTKVILQ
jgi:Secretion system C-terminal sorting domain